MKIILTIDVGHPPRKPERVEFELEEAVSEVKRKSSLRIIKVIHGRSGNTKVTVRNWAYKHRRRLCGIIYGENYSIFDRQTQEMRDTVGQFVDSDLENSNSGITILWVK